MNKIEYSDVISPKRQLVNCVFLVSNGILEIVFLRVEHKNRIHAWQGSEFMSPQQELVNVFDSIRFFFLFL